MNYYLKRNGHTQTGDFHTAKNAMDQIRRNWAIFGYCGIYTIHHPNKKLEAQIFIN